MRGWLSRYLERHQHPACLALHIIGVPLLIAALILAAVQLCMWRWDLWWRPAVMIIVSYALQGVGHHIEGNDLGEVVAIKKLMGRPYVAISPRYQRSQHDNEHPSGDRSPDDLR